MKTTEQAHAEMVKALVKPPEKIIDNILEQPFGNTDIMHACIGIAGEGGEILDNMKRVVIYNQGLTEAHRVNFIEELGDLEFYMQQLRSRLGITREQTLLSNMEKLAERYKKFQYTDQAAKDRADKLVAHCASCAAPITLEVVLGANCPHCGSGLSMSQQA